MSNTTPPQTFTGRRRNRRTRVATRLPDLVARALITAGGLGTIIAVFMVCVFLVWVVVPLFLPESLQLRHEVAVERPANSHPVHVAADEYLMMGMIVFDSGRVQIHRLDTGELIDSSQLASDKQPVSWSFSPREGNLALAFDDGTVQLGRIGFSTSFLPADQVTPELKRLPKGEVARLDNGLVSPTGEGEFRLQQFALNLEEPVTVHAGARLALIDHSVSSKGSIFAVLSDTGQLSIAQVTETRNVITRQVTKRLREGNIQVELPDGQLPRHLLLSGLGDSVLLAWEDGQVMRFDTRSVTAPELAEQLDLVPEDGARLTSLAFLIGKTSLVAGDSLGRVGVWFGTKPDQVTAPDGIKLARGHDLGTAPAAVTSLGSSPRSRLLAAGYGDDRLRLFQVTSGHALADGVASVEQVSNLPTNPNDSTRIPEPAVSIEALAISPKDDAVLTLTGNRLRLWSIDAPHPETTWSSILRPIWYEGANHPEHVWQSSSGTDDFEPKFGLMPLIFGTLKATCYSMLFGVPLALLAAIYSSEFLRPRLKARIKPTIEIMASLPSVVLGFLAALVLAPLVENIVPEVLLAFVTIPFAFLLGGYVWQFAPSNWTVRARRYRLLGMAVALPLGVLLAAQFGPALERWLFSGDIKAWLDGQIGTGGGAWVFLLLPLSAIVAAAVCNRFISPRQRQVTEHWGSTAFAMLDLGKFLLGCGLTIAVAYAASWLLTVIGWDPRGTFVGTYVQRNSLVVGFMMGFAVIPIIYTIADDALSAVPESLRAASLGTGATPWQTAIRVVVPTAMSGLFSALMIGLGRAVGETMIVLMAAGNTPIMNWNIFSGFRTLSANIAVELPEAVVNSTHYRMLFLAALSLFVMTFVINTIAEVVRLRFRRRAFQL